jgi:hypothetical protein
MLSEEAAEELLERYAAAWASNRTDRIAGCWDAQGFLFYKAEEVTAFFRRWPEVLDYWRHNEALHERVVLRFADAQILDLGDDLAALLVRMRWDIRFAADAALPDGSAFAHRGVAMGGDNHVLALLGAAAEEPHGWLFRGWSETPDAPITYFRSLYQRQADLEVLY